MVSMSDLYCCPVCWELIRFLREETAITQGNSIVYPDENDLVLRGCRLTVNSVMLPMWLPEHIRYGMISRFQGYLRKELCGLLNFSPADNHKLKRHVTRLTAMNFTVGRSKGIVDSEIGDLSPLSFQIYRHHRIT